MRHSSSLVLAATLATLAFTGSAMAQADPSKPPLDPSATCPQETRDSITTCLGTIYTEEAKLPGGPCSSSDWPCICTLQQGLIDCYKPCPGIQPAEDITFNQNSCNGQNGAVNAANGGSISYTWSPITTTGAPGSSGGPVASTTAAPTTTAGASTVSASTTGGLTSGSGTSSTNSAGTATRTSSSSGTTGAQTAAPNAAPGSVAAPGASFATGAAWAVMLSVVFGVLTV